MSGSLTKLKPLNDRMYRAPREHGEILSVPLLRSAQTLAEGNQRQLNSATLQFAGVLFAEYRNNARQEILEVATRFTSQFADVPEARDSISTPIYVTGHQPQFVHPGVWAKNLAVGLLAKQHGSIGLNLVVDNDVADLFGVHVPDGTLQQPHLNTVLFDDPQLPQPWEEVRLKNKLEFANFAGSVQHVMDAWNIDSCLQDVWPAAIAASEQCDCTILPLTAARAKLERTFGLENLEIPVSSLCETTAFLQFVVEILDRHEQFFASYNAAVAWYRTTHSIRNDRHPVPDLELLEGRYELPFWFWKQGEHQRERVFVKREHEQFVLFAGNVELLRAPLKSLLSELKQLQKIGKLRTKALSTTMFTRLAIADLFVHGIGGAKYDEITDRIISNFFKMQVPAFLTLSATLHLPVKSFSVTQEDLLTLEKQLRDLKFNAERYLDSAEASPLALRKQELLAEQNAAQTIGLSKRERHRLRPINRKRHLELKSIQQQLEKIASDKIEQCQLNIQNVSSQLKANSVLKSREFAAVLFPTQSLNELVQRLRDAIQTT